MTNIYPVYVTYDGSVNPTGLQEITYTLPTADGISGQTLVTNGTGTLSFATIDPLSPTNELFLSCAGGWDSTTSPAGGFTTTDSGNQDVNIRGTLFSLGDSDIYHEWSHPMPSDYGGGNITAIPYVYIPTTSDDASSHTIILGLAGVAFADGDTANTTFGTPIESTETVASSIAGKIIKMAATAEITIGNGPLAGDWVQWRMYRKGSDTFNKDIVVLGWMITYTRA